MILLELKGGLGNQLFQYACGRALSLRHGEELKFDIGGYENSKLSDTPREYLLSKFNIQPTAIATVDEIRSLKYPYGLVSKILRKIRVKLNLNDIGFVPRITKKRGSIYLSGYYQTEKYFIDKESVIRQELTLKNKLSPGAQIYAELIKKNSPSVSIHVRRGDVARDAKTNPYYGITTTEYYAQALRYIDAHVTNPHIFVFSDDIEWVKKNIPISQEVTYVSHGETEHMIPDYEELVLMSMCNHNIIANSSFSWWSAWLNENKTKIIVAPKEWITRHTWQHKDTVPDSWIRI